MKTKVIKLTISPDVQVLCELFSISPQQLLSRFMADLCSEVGNGGSDERRMAKDYFLRGGMAVTEEWHWEHNGDILEDFESLYKASYPYANDENKEWKKKRANFLNELREIWLNEKSKMASR